ncbi:MAG: CHASE2 domain-containing protein, partial [Betaproteobacteria bacterium]
MKPAFWRSDWFLGVGVVVLVAIFSRSSELIPSLERKAYDLGVKATARTPSDKIAVISIDKQSIDNIGRWPWPRDVHAKMVDKLAKANAKVVAYTVFFSEPENQKINQTISKLLEAASTPSGEAAATQPSPAGGNVLALLKDAEEEFDTDRRLANSFSAAKNVVLPILFEFGIPRGKPDKALPEFIRRNAVAITAGSDELPLQTNSLAISIIDSLGSAAASIGHLNAALDVDGAIRTEALAATYYDEYYPSLAVMIVARSLNLGPKDIQIRPGEAIQIGSLRATTDPQARMFTYFYPDRDKQRAIPEDSFFDVHTDKIPAEKYRDKIVLIGPTAPGVSNVFVTPVDPAMPAVTLQAHTVSSLLQEHFFVAPAWAPWAELGIILLLAAYIIAVLPRLQAGPALVVSGAMFATLVVAHFALMVGAGLWLQLMLPATLLLFGHAALVSKRFIVTEAAKQKSDESSAESNRMLGLAYQGQGQLDLAWDKFRQVPMSAALADTLYNLALDFERKRQFNKAESVFRTIHDFDPKFKDVAEKV